MIKINGFLNRKFLSLTVNEWLGITVAVTAAEAVHTSFHTESVWLGFIIWAVTWIAGMVLYTVVIALIKTYITKED